jgi:hypothetical protein
MSAYAWAVRPNGLVSHRGHRGHGGLHTLLQVLMDVCEIVAFSYRLRTAGSAVRTARSAAR